MYTGLSDNVKHFVQKQVTIIFTIIAALIVEVTKRYMAPSQIIVRDGAMPGIQTGMGSTVAAARGRCAEGSSGQGLHCRMVTGRRWLP